MEQSKAVSVSVALVLVGLVGWAIMSSNTRYVTFELSSVMVMPPGQHQPVKLTVGSIIWDRYEITAGWSGGNFIGSMKGPEGTYPLAADEVIALMVYMDNLSKYLRASEQWYAGGGKYIRPKNNVEDKCELGECDSSILLDAARGRSDAMFLDPGRISTRLTTMVRSGGQNVRPIRSVVVAPM